MTVKDRFRTHRRVLTIVSVVVSFGAIAIACQDTRRSQGEECIKNVDCESDICLDQRCVAAGPILDRDATPAPTPDGSTTMDSATVDAPPDSPVETGSDAATD
jgi:hypothetical protein